MKIEIEKRDDGQSLPVLNRIIITPEDETEAAILLAVSLPSVSWDKVREIGSEDLPSVSFNFQG